MFNLPYVSLTLILFYFYFPYFNFSIFPCSLLYTTMYRHTRNQLLNCSIPFYYYQTSYCTRVVHQVRHPIMCSEGRGSGLMIRGSVLLTIDSYWVSAHREPIKLVDFPVTHRLLINNFPKLPVGEKSRYSWEKPLC